ncbi:GNAT family N-acetyltransferase [Lacinutrix sp. C3R15]|uniref:GNAT family N-acetyltransferase n=1 Tax=Flavobacteriaceae TaxID=49546 RepID=UPI001C08F571|nr:MULTISPECIES: GNAT family N-acetyltransferase [Flavobacteriaceae]MBU2940674.1 GNAT family N-acetyltransferase [Lacinutrix sp. C3R15]MDO6623992.1 GNAT family N-acetyltransferase [Oceanihabitans sp. 1_MG-2023]
MHLIKTNSENPDFIYLVKQLDAYLKIMDGEEHEFYNQFNNIDVLKNTIVAYVNNIPVGCGAFKEFNTTSVEIKRMFTCNQTRSQGIATQVLNALENWAKELGYKTCILETGKRQVEAVQFYKKNKYKTIPNYGQYINMENSLCFEKELI